MKEELTDVIADAERLLNSHRKSPISLKGDGCFLHSNTPIPPHRVLVELENMRVQLRALVVAIELNKAEADNKPT